MSTAFIGKLLAPLPEGEGFDGPAYLEQIARDERVTQPANSMDRHVAYALDWLRKNDPRFGGKGWD